ncbi:SGNH/GDSL hydrolase family protein [Fulvivirgaceae bacterium BMA12]|uniref:SGNH/GDSL hydrolase family protein n=1 Tax=Agaribacillus aureus TaxID=3051825 RepID=A0ABT8L3K5_9BACT|nr:SGNH/GDSL hydrolase family protein [Fulvivirgaceae bacterium BMA12]
MKKHSIKELVILILMFFLAFKGFTTPANEPCLTVSKVKIVVIGADAHHDKNQNGELFWIKSYRDYLKSFNKDNEIINLTQKELNSYHIVPTGSTSPYGRPKADPDHNITKAISMTPDAIIVNLEYNDLVQNFQASEQIVNLMLVASEANNKNIPIWINTPKPSTFDTPENHDSHIAVKELIMQRFHPFVVKFWDALADENGNLRQEFATADQGHVNAKGQEVMASKLVEADIHQYCARRKYKGGKDISIYSLKSEDQLSTAQSRKFKVTIANSGSEIDQEISINLDLINQQNNQKYSQNKIIGRGLESCQFKSIEFTVNDLPYGDYKVSAYVAKRIDRNPDNDTTHMTLKHLALNTPAKGQTKKIQVDNKVELYAINIDGFSSHFNRYNKEEAYSFTNGGDVKVYEIEDIFNEQDTESTTFKILAERIMEISAFEVEVENPGAKLVEVFYKRNLNEQKDNSLEYWNLASSQEIFVEKGSNQIEISTKDIHLDRKDNVGIYIRTRDLSGLPMSRNK